MDDITALMEGHEELAGLGREGFEGEAKGLKLSITELRERRNESGDSVVWPSGGEVPGMQKRNGIGDMR